MRKRIVHVISDAVFDCVLLFVLQIAWLLAYFLLDFVYFHDVSVQDKLGIVIIKLVNVSSILRVSSNGAIRVPAISSADIEQC